MGKSGTPRYAIYYAPAPETPLARFGARWLGWDAQTGDEPKRLKVPGLEPSRIREITEAPALYGFHGTLKPPFRLAKGFDLAMLDEALESFGASHAPFKVPALELAELDGFIALRPKKTCPELNALAAACVKDFDTFRAPPTEKELKKRLKADLSKTHKKLLEKWGYPYVMDEFRFHMTLTGRLDDPERKDVLKALKRELTGILSGKAWKLNIITLFEQPALDLPFEVVKCYELKPPSRTRWPVKKP